MNLKTKIIDTLIVYREYYSSKEDGRYFGYSRAIGSLNNTLSEKDSKEDILNLLDQGIYGIGESIDAKIRMILADELPPHFDEFSKELVQEKAAENPHKHYQTRVSAQNLISPITKSFDERGIVYYLCGSFRRESFIVGDLDILVVWDDLSFATEMIDLASMNSDLQITYLARGSQKIKIEVKDSHDHVIEVDLRAIPSKQLGSMLLHFTGPRDFNIMMRRRAISLGYSLSEYGLTNSKGRLITSDSEKFFFDVLGMEYIEPKNRK